MVILQRLSDPPHHIDGFFFGRLFNFYHLETTGQRWVTLKIFFVFSPGRRSNSAQLATCQCRFQKVCCIALSFFSARANHGVSFIDEQNNRSDGSTDFFNNRFKTVLKFAFHARTCLQQAKVESTYSNTFQRFRHVTRGNTQSEAFNHCGLTDTGFTRHDRVVLTTAGQDVDALTNLFITAKYRVNLATLSTLR